MRGQPLDDVVSLPNTPAGCPSMNNPSMLAATALIGLALVVGVFAYLSTAPADGIDAPVVAKPNLTQRVEFKDLSPWEQRKKANLEDAQRYLHQVKQEGKEVEGGLIRIRDTDGSPLYVYPELVEGVGANGEPLYMLAKVKRKAAVPLVERKAVPEKFAPTVKGAGKSLSFTKPNSEDNGSEGGGQGLNQKDEN